MIRHLAGLLAAALFCATGALAEAPPTNAPGMPVGTGLQPTALYDATGKIVDPSPGAKTSSGAFQPPTAAAGKIVDTSVALSVNTSTVLVAARATPGDRLAVEIQCDGTGIVAIDMKGGTLTSTAGPRVIPSGSYPLYTPPIATQTAITAYTGTAQTCRVTEYLR